MGVYDTHADIKQVPMGVYDTHAGISSKCPWVFMIHMQVGLSSKCPWVFMIHMQVGVCLGHTAQLPQVLLTSSKLPPWPLSMVPTRLFSSSTEDGRRHPHLMATPKYGCSTCKATCPHQITSPFFYLLSTAPVQRYQLSSDFCVGSN